MKARAVIIGGGIIGLAVAYYLGRAGWRDVVVVEKDHLNAGASARCGGGYRLQWSTPLNIEIMKRAVKLFEKLPAETGENIWLRKGGYLFIAKSEDQAQQLEQNVRLQNEHGVATKLLTRGEIRSLCPFLNLDGVTVAAFNPTDGSMFPFSAVWALDKGVRKYGNKVLTHREVIGIEREGNAVRSVVTSKEKIDTEIVVNAAGAWAPIIGKMAGIDLPNYPEKHEAIVTEPLRPFMPMNICPMDSGLWVSQTMRGELYACLGVDKGPAQNYDSTFRFIRKVSRLLVDLIPRLAEVKVMRQWGGFYDITPDTNPILGPVEGVEGFIQCHGFMGHGFMMAPAIGEIIADFLDNGTVHSVIGTCRLERFRYGRLESEKMIIG